jgi:translation initiation factor IF-2
MPKARVFELAKELGMQYEELLDRLSSMGMEGINRMSALDEEEIRRIKAEIGPPKPKLYEERRVARTVIRRRKKETAEPEVEAAIEAEAALPEEVAPTVEIPPEPIKPVEVKPVEESKPVEEAKIPVAEEEVKPSERVEPEVPKIVPAPKPPKEKTEEPTARAEIPAEEKALPIEDKAPEKAQETTVTRVGAAPKEAVEIKAKKPAVKKLRKVRKEEPARIIKMPEPETKAAPSPAPQPMPKERPAAKVLPISLPEAAIETEEEILRKGKKKKAKKFEKVPQEEIPAIRKPFVKRKEVLERADLYDEDRIRPFKIKKSPKALQKTQRMEPTIPKAIKRRIKMVSDSITVSDLARKIGVKATEVVKKLFSLGISAGINQAIEFDAAALVASEFDYEVEKKPAPRGGIFGPSENQGREPGSPASSDNGYGTCRPRQNHPPGRHQANQCRQRGSGRNHPAHRGIPCQSGQRVNNLSGYARP